jgi:hypothetical protein
MMITIYDYKGCTFGELWIAFYPGQLVFKHVLFKQTGYAGRPGPVVELMLSV